jgi:hypothetical protein
MIIGYEQMFGEKSKDQSSLLKKNDHPELDESDLLNLDDIPKYHNMVGATQWAISFGRLGI